MRQPERDVVNFSLLELHAAHMGLGDPMLADAALSASPSMDAVQVGSVTGKK